MNASDVPIALRPGWEPLTVNQRKFLVCLETEVGNITKAAELCGMTRKTHYYWLKESEAYREAAGELSAAINDRIMREFFRRGVEGVAEPVFYQGEQCGTKMVYDTPALIALAKARMPKKFRENFKGHIQVDGGVSHELRQQALLDPEMFELMLEAANRLSVGGDGARSSEHA